MMRDIAREYVTARIRARYAEQPAFDTGERDERRARSQLKPQGDVIVVMSCPRATTAESATKEVPMCQSIPVGARVRSNLGPCGWVGTVTRHNTNNEAFPVRVAWDTGVVENCMVGELTVLAVPAGAPVDPDVLERALEHYSHMRADARMDQALGESRN